MQSQRLFVPSQCQRSTLAVMDDALLLEAWRDRRDEASLATLMERYSAGLRAALRRRLVDPAQVEDALQATWITLTRKAGSIRDPARLLGWLHACADRIALDLLRSAGRRRAAERAAGAERLDGLDDSEPGAQDEAAWLRARLDAAIARISPASREAVLRFYLHGQPQTVAAAACGISESAFQMRLDYGLKQLRRLLGTGSRPAGLAALLALLGAEARAADGAAPAVAAITQPAAAPAALATGCIKAMTTALVLKVAVATLVATLIGAGAVIAAEVAAVTPAAVTPVVRQPRDLFAEGVKQYRAGSYGEAQRAFRQALEAEPANDKVVYEFYLAAGDVLVVKMMEQESLRDVLGVVLRRAKNYQTALQADPAYQRRLAAMADDAPAGPAAAIKDRLAQRITVDFQDTPFDEVLRFIASVSGAQLDVRPGVNAVPITLKTKDMALSLMIDWITQMAGAAWRVEGGTLIIAPK